MGSTLHALTIIRRLRWLRFAIYGACVCVHAVPELRSPSAQRSFTNEVANAEYDMRIWRQVLHIALLISFHLHQTSYSHCHLASCCCYDHTLLDARCSQGAIQLSSL